MTTISFFIAKSYYAKLLQEKHRRLRAGHRTSLRLIIRECLISFNPLDGTKVLPVSKDSKRVAALLSANDLRKLQRYAEESSMVEVSNVSYGEILRRAVAAHLK